MVIFKGQDDGTGAVGNPIIYTGVTLTFTGTLRAFFQRKYLSDFTITSVEGTFVSQVAGTSLAQTQIIGSLDTLVNGHTGDTYEEVNLADGGVGTGTGAEATVIVNPSGVITSVIITNGGSGYAVSDELDIPGSVIGGGNQGLTLTLSNLQPIYTTQIVNLKQVYMDAEDALDTTGNLIFTVYNTLDHDLNYKYAFVTRIYDSL